MQGCFNIKNSSSIILNSVHRVGLSFVKSKLRTLFMGHTSLGDPSSRVFLLMAVSPCWMKPGTDGFRGPRPFSSALSRDDVFYCHQMAFVVRRPKDSVYNFNGFKASTFQDILLKKGRSPLKSRQQCYAPKRPKGYASKITSSRSSNRRVTHEKGSGRTFGI